MKYYIQKLAETDSTNARIRESLIDGTLPSFTVISTDYQVSGRGQQGNRWESERAKNLLFSVYIEPIFVPVKSQFLISQIVTLSIVESLMCYAEGFSIKWPNDIYWNQKKICGVLIEHNLSGAMLSQSIIGIGLNVNQIHFHSDAPNPVSLVNILDEEVDRELLLNDILFRLERYYSLLQQGDSQEIVERYHSLLFRKEGYHQYADKTGRFMAEIVRVEPDGRFVLRTDKGDERGYLFKEVQVIL